MIYIILIILLIITSHIIGHIKPFLDKNSYYDNAYYYFYDNKYIPNYTGVCFYKMTNGIRFLDIQTGSDGFDKCITICNISFIWGIK